MINDLVDKLVDDLDPPTLKHEERWREKITEALEAAQHRGYERGHDHGEESMKSWLKGGYE